MSTVFVYRNIYIKKNQITGSMAQVEGGKRLSKRLSKGQNQFLFLFACCIQTGQINIKYE